MASIPKPSATNVNNGITRVAVVQAASVSFNLEATLKKLETLCKEAADKGAKLVMFPEAFLSGYPKGCFFADMNDYYGKEAGTVRDKYRMYWESSIEIPGPIVDRLGTIARTSQVYMVVGVIEREGGTLYCCVVHFNSKGEFLGKHRKLVPTTYERLVWGKGDGSTLPIFNTEVGTFGSVICWENYMPLMRLTMYSKGIQIYLAPNADGTERWNATMRHIALEGRCFVLSCVQSTHKSDYPPGYLDPQFDKFQKELSKMDNYPVLKGGSCIVDPLGQYLAEPIYNKEGILYADLDIGDCIRGKLDMDVMGHYARPDVFTLYVNTKEQHNVLLGAGPQVGPCHGQEHVEKNKLVVEEKVGDKEQ